MGLGVGVAGFVFIEGYGLGDAIYMAVITISTVGFGEIHELSQQGRYFTSVLILFNIGIFAYLISVFGFYIVEGEIFKRLHEAKMDRKISELENHVVLCGFGRHGHEIVEHLNRFNIPFVAIESDSELLDEIRDTDMLYIEGDATLDEILRKARMGQARALITSLPDDSDNVYITLSARSMNPTATIVARAYKIQSNRKLQIAGADHIVQPEQVGGFYMATLITKPSAIGFFNHIINESDSDIGFEEVTYPHLPDELKDRTIAETDLRAKTGVNIIGLRRADGSYHVNPSPQESIIPDSCIIVVGDKEQLGRFRKYIRENT
jgi:voltage-gated potassium channel